MRILLVGAGGVGSAFAAIAARREFFEVIVVADYDEAIRFFVDALGFALTEDTPAMTNDGRAKRWVVVHPGGAATASAISAYLGDRLRPRRRQP